MIRSTEGVIVANLDVFDRLFVHFCRHPSFRDALKRSDPVMWRRLRDTAMWMVREADR